MALKRHLFRAFAAIALPLLWCNALAEGESASGSRFYQNYGSEPYSREDVKRDAESYYDLFGDHITDGFQVYNLHNDRTSYSLTNSKGFDSLGLAVSQEWATSHYWDNFTNLVITRDEIGGLKSTILMGDQIKTRFTPFTLNMSNYKGIRWDVWSQRLKLTALASRTRPGAMARAGIQRIVSNVTSPLIDGSFVDYPSGQWTPESDWITTGKLNSDKSTDSAKGFTDYSNKSPYSDYDFFWGLHAETDLGQYLQAGLTYMNHHHTDLAKGEELRGNIPDAWIPEEIHFEFYDLTYDRTDDAGCFIDGPDNFRMKIVSKEGVEHDAGGPSACYAVSMVDSTFYSVRLPRTAHGLGPVLVAFQPLAPQIPHGLDAQQIRHVKFTYNVAGNYLVFVSTDKFIPPGIPAYIDESGTRTVTYGEPFHVSVSNMFQNGIPFSGESKQGGLVSGREGVTYFGDFIAKSPHPTPLSRQDFDNSVSAFILNPAAGAPVNYRPYSYEFAIRVNSITYGANFRSQILGANLSGEVAVNIKDSKFPGKANDLEYYASRQERNLVLQFKANREFGEKFRMDAEGYRIDPNFETNLTEFQPSLFISKAYYAYPRNRTGNFTYSLDYLNYPKPLSNEWLSVDDNEDNDILVENGRRHYPSNTGELDAYQFYYNDQILRTSFIGQTNLARTVLLPTGMEKIYDDPNGVIPDRYDRNKNGTVDYEEDFLLYSSDPPLFDLANDMNFNGVFDNEEDDMLPDYPYQLPYTITSNAYMSNGLQGLRAKTRFRPTGALELNVGTVIESARNMNLTGNYFESGDKPENGEGVSRILYGSEMWRVAARERRMDYFLGNETFLVQDGIRNDAIQTRGAGVYRFVPDPMRFRNAIVNNLIGGLNLSDIPNLEIGTRAMLGIELMRSLPGQEFYITRMRTYLTSANEDSIAYEAGWEEYGKRTIGKAYLIQKFGYRKTWDYSFEGWRAALNLLNRLEILPRYKISYEFRRNLSEGPTERDPRQEENFFAQHLLSPAEQTQIRNSWIEYDLNTESLLMSVPILLCNFQIASRTRIESGIQWERVYDRIVQTNSYSKTTKIAQLVSRDNYNGYNIAIMFGIYVADTRADANLRNELLDTGVRLNEHRSEIFAKIYAGL